MPLYEYQCLDCEKVFVVVLTLAGHERGGVECPGCQSKKVSQMISSFTAKTASKT